MIYNDDCRMSLKRLEIRAGVLVPRLIYVSEIGAGTYGGVSS